MPKKRKVEQLRTAQAWERQPGESERAYSAFKVWLEMEPASREFVQAYRHFSSNPSAKQASGLFNSWVGQWNWQARALEYDRWVFRQQKEAELAATIAERAKWAKRRAEVADEEWDLSLSLRKKAREMLNFPLATQTVTNERQGEDGRTVLQEITIEPTGWRMRDVASYLAMADKLMRLATDQATERIETIDPASQQEDRLREARLVLAESQQLFDQIDPTKQAEQVAQAFGVPLAELLASQTMTTSEHVN